MAIATLQKAGIATEGLTSKSWDVFAVPDAPHMDLVITVCDNAAGEVCPYWPGQPATAHWGYEDPSEAVGGDAEKLEAFLQTLHLIKKRLEILISLPVGTLSKMALKIQCEKWQKNEPLEKVFVGACWHSGFAMRRYWLWHHGRATGWR